MNIITLIIGGLGGPELIVIALIVLLLFGGRKVPELMKGLGKGIREFNNAKANIQSEINEGMKEVDAAPKAKSAEKEKVSLKAEDAIDENKGA
jgi:sec-independent protein translocase protein TatA